MNAAEEQAIPATIPLLLPTGFSSTVGPKRIFASHVEWQNGTEGHYPIDHAPVA